MSNDLEYKIGADASPFKKDLDGLVSQARGSAMQLAGALGIGFGVKEAVSGVIDIAKGLDLISDSAKAAGISTDFFQELAYGAKLSNLDIGNVTNAFQKIKQEANKASTDVGAYTMFHDLGIDVKELKGMKPEQLFKTVANSLIGLKDSTMQEVYAQQIFGKNWQALLPFLQNWQALAQEARDRGQIFTPEAIEAGERFTDSMERLQMAAKGFVANSGLLEYLADYIQTADELITDRYKKAETIRKTGATGFYTSMASNISDYSSFIPGIGPIFSGMESALNASGSKMIETSPITAEQLAEFKAMHQTLKDRLPGNTMKGEPTK